MESKSLQGPFLVNTVKGPRKMLSSETRRLINRLHNEGKSVRELARSFNVARGTVRRCIRNNYQSERKLSSKRTFLNEHRDEIKKMYFEHEGYCVPLQRTILQQFHEDINIRMLERFCKGFREAMKQEVSAMYRTVRYETEPGDQLQIDFGEKEILLGNESTKVYFFVCKLGYSRRIFAKAYLNKKEQSWLDGLESAFHYFGGLPITIVSDNDSSLLKVSEEGRRKVFNEGYRHFVDYYGLHAITCAVRKPRSKGKVESAVKYLKMNALPGKSFESIKQLNTYLEGWCKFVTDLRKMSGFPEELNTPKERFLIEAKALRPLVLSKIANVRFESRKVASNGLVSVDGNSYALGMSYAAKEVQVQISENSIVVSAPGRPSITLNKATEVYRPIQQKIGATAEQIRQSNEQQIKRMDVNYQANPFQRPLSDYDKAIGYKRSRK